MDSNSPEIVMYGTTWCGDTRRSRAFLEEKKIPYRWVDIELDVEGRRFVEKVNKGFRSVPTIVFPDGTILTEPSNTVLANKIASLLNP
jgi:mycoredoxin